MIKEVQETINSIKASLYDRSADPFIGKYLLYFLLLNWRVFYILLFGEGGGGYRLAYVRDQFGFPWEYIDQCSSIDFVLGLLKTYGLPFVLAGLHFLLYPSIKKKLVIFWEEKKAELENSKNEVAKVRLLTYAQGIDLKEKILKLEKALEESKIKDYDTSRFAHFALLGYASQYSVNIQWLRVLKMPEIDVARLSVPGLWIILNIQSLYGRFHEASAGNQLSEQEYPAIFLEKLNQEYVIVQWQGNIDLKDRSDLTVLKYEWGNKYKFSATNLGYLDVLDESKDYDKALHTCEINEDGILKIASTPAQISIGGSRVRVFRTS